MKRVLLATVTALALTACGSTAPKPTGSAQTPSPTSSDSAAAEPTDEPTSDATSSSTSTARPGTTASSSSTAAASSPSGSAAPAPPVLRVGIIAADRPSFEKLLDAQRTLGNRAVSATWVSSCAQLSGVDLALVQGQSCAGTSFPVLSAGPALTELTAGLTAITALTVDDRVKLLLDRVLTPKTGSLGVVVESCAPNERAVTQTLTPTAKQRGFTLAATAGVPCGRAAEAGRAVASLQAKQVAQVVFVSGGDEAGLVRAFTKTAAAKRFAPLYGITSAAAPATLADQRDRMVGVGWLPSLDTTAVTASAEINDCMRALRKAGADAPSGPAGRFSAYGACDLIRLAASVLRETKGSTDAGAFRKAVSALGRAFRAANLYDAATDFRTRQTGPATGSAFAWTKSCPCFSYTGSSFAV